MCTWFILHHFEQRNKLSEAEVSCLLIHLIKPQIKVENVGGGETIYSGLKHLLAVWGSKGTFLQHLVTVPCAGVYSDWATQTSLVRNYSFYLPQEASCSSKGGGTHCTLSAEVSHSTSVCTYGLC